MPHVARQSNQRACVKFRRKLFDDFRRTVKDLLFIFEKKRQCCYESSISALSHKLFARAERAVKFVIKVWSWKDKHPFVSVIVDFAIVLASVGRNRGTR